MPAWSGTVAGAGYPSSSYIQPCGLPMPAMHLNFWISCWVAEPSCSQQLMESDKKRQQIPSPPSVPHCRMQSPASPEDIDGHSGIAASLDITWNCSTERIPMDSAGLWRCIKHFASFCHQRSGLLWDGGTTKGPRESMVSRFKPSAPAFAKSAPYPHIWTNVKSHEIAKKSWESRKAPKSCQMRHIQFANHVNHVNFVSALMWSSS